MKYDGVFSHSDTKEIVDIYGWDTLLDKLNGDFPGRSLYSVSTDWHNDSQYLCKARGSKGDVIIGWSEWGGWKRD